MTKFRNFFVSCALVAASMIPPVAPVQAMPRPALDIEVSGPADVQNVRHRGRYGRHYGWGPSFYHPWRPGFYPGLGPGFHAGWGPSYYPGLRPYRRSGFSLFIGSGFGHRSYYPRHYYYGNRYYYGTRFYGPGYYSYRSYHPGYYRPGIIRRGYGAHATWCLSRYRSYDPATNRFLAYGGVYRVCYSPYR
ncbi:BA14K family protein [Sinorhizobium numidicum]|uniref:Lectin-like protein BA14k n=1 Tax=Sinorhizobium numidicum TaxID=680248 RepID=A0ABY8D093_9HYPH|nr:BA14K family protein [Sinorhizobium numidicum]WEX77631.1 BA14K family protein [Sinorhizobium numidicum]WEX84291.1 BA14K family protein [Sinorhizobium numidicum]